MQAPQIRAVFRLYSWKNPSKAGLDLLTVALSANFNGLSGQAVHCRRYSLGEFHRGFSLSDAGDALACRNPIKKPTHAQCRTKTNIAAVMPALPEEGAVR
jgi:hypothetical protein